MPTASPGPNAPAVIKTGLSKGWQAYVWLMKIIVPISFLTMLLLYSDWMGKLDVVLTPVMGLLHLPAMAALPLLVGVIANVYGGLAIMAVLPLSQVELTLLAIFLMISHNLVQEGIIQARSGVHPLKIILIRLTASVLTVICVAPLLGAGVDLSGQSAAVASSSATAAGTLGQTVGQWMFDTLSLALKLLIILLLLMTLIEFIKVFALAQKIQNGLAPLLKIMGLRPQVGLLWLVGVLFGVAFGAAVIREEFERGYLAAEDMERLHVSIGINHSMIEDPIIFMLLGLQLFWLVVPRLVASMAAVHVLIGWQKISSRM